jgi:hypothetical protein
LTESFPQAFCTTFGAENGSIFGDFWDFQRQVAPQSQIGLPGSEKVAFRN